MKKKGKLPLDSIDKEQYNAVMSSIFEKLTIKSQKPPKDFEKW